MDPEGDQPHKITTLYGWEAIGGGLDRPELMRCFSND